MRVVTVARKPLSEGNVASNVARHGTGAYNIDATRIAHDPGVNLDAMQRQQTLNPIQFGGAKPGDVIQMYKPGGRWPANLILSHLPECRQVGMKKVKASSGVRPSDVGRDYEYQHQSGSMAGPKRPILASTYCDEDGQELVENWECASGCPVAALDANSGPTGSWSPKSRLAGEMSSGNLFGRRQEGSHYGDFGGGASRFFKRVRP